MVAELEAETPGATLAYVETEAPVKTLADNCRGDGRDRWCDIKEVKAKALVQRPANTIRQLKAKTSSGTLHDKEVKRLVNMPADRQPELKAITVGNKDGNVQANYCSILWRKGKHKCSPRKEATQRPMIEALHNTLPKDGRRDTW